MKTLYTTRWENDIKPSDDFWLSWVEYMEKQNEKTVAIVYEGTTMAGLVKGNE